MRLVYCFDISERRYLLNFEEIAILPLFLLLTWSLSYRKAIKKYIYKIRYNKMIDAYELYLIVKIKQYEINTAH